MILDNLDAFQFEHVLVNVKWHFFNCTCSEKCALCTVVSLKMKKIKI